MTVTVEPSGIPDIQPLRLIDMVFPGDTNHHGTLFGGVALAHMDKIAFLAAARHGRASFVTAASDRIDFAAPARTGDMVEASAWIVRVGTRSLDVAVELVAEAPVSGARHLCTRGRFTLVAAGADVRLPPVPTAAPVAGSGAEGGAGAALHMVDMVFPPQTNHYGTLYGGDALKMMGKAAFVAATRHQRAVMVMAASERIDFHVPIRTGDMVELVATIARVGTRSIAVAVDLWSEDLMTGARQRSARGLFTMVAVSPPGDSCVA